MRNDPLGGGVGGGLRRRIGKLTGLMMAALALYLALVAMSGAEQRLRPMDLHATVINGRIIGSAFQLDRGLAVTNAHVVRGRRAGEIVQLVSSGGRGVRTSGEILAISSRMDLALIRITEGFLPVAPAQRGHPQVGQTLRAAGVVAEPGLPNDRMELEGRVIAAGVHLAPFGPGFVAALPGVRRGFSGGPVLDAQGHLVGMIAALRPGARNEAVAASGFAPQRQRLAGGTEAFILGAAEIRSEVRRLLD